MSEDIYWDLEIPLPDWKAEMCEDYFLEHLKRQREWSFETFGPARGSAGAVDHLRKELKEVEENPKDLEEWADVIILAFDSAMREGFAPADILKAIYFKQAKNEYRKWPDWTKSEPGKAIEHIKD